MKLVKEHINEKFEKDSDPIKDMNIGLYALADNFFRTLDKTTTSSPRNFINNCLYIKDSKTDQIKGFMYYYGDNVQLYNFIGKRDIKKITNLREFNKKENCYEEQIPIKDIFKINFFKEKTGFHNYYKIEARKGIANTGRKTLTTIDEKFKEISDPIKDMGIGFKVFVVLTNIVNENWQISPGVDIIFAGSEKEAREIWNSRSKPYYTQAIEIRLIHELDINENYHSILDPTVE